MLDYLTETWPEFTRELYSTLTALYTFILLRACQCTETVDAKIREGMWTRLVSNKYTISPKITILCKCYNTIAFTDSHHKLIRWRIVTHGAIDGYSRLIVYLHASTNNQARTVYNLFLAAVQEYQLPSRVRSDQGTENMLVAQYMIEKRGASRRSMITGSSVHNQRIERLWRDMHRSCTILYYRMFYFLEQHNILDHLNEHHLWALHYIFIPRINRSLQEFKNGWNNHPIRTAGYKSPQQLFTAGCLLLQNSQIPALDFFHSVDGDYGIDPEGPLPPSEGGVFVPQSSLRFSDEDIHFLRQNIDPCGPSDNYGIDLYEHTVQFISSFTPQ